jgi:hypothetical protein
MPAFSTPIRGILLSLVAAGFFTAASTTQAHELTGFVSAETRLYPNSARYIGQDDHSASLVFKPEYYHEFKDGSSFTFVPFYRLNSADQERTHFDIRELTLLWLQDDFELRLGVRKVFWGTTEFFHLVDIINQFDLVENIDFEDKLGQPMANISFSRDWGTLDLFWLPYFRERTFPGTGGRLRGAAVIDTDQAEYESAAKEWHSDWAFRYSHYFGDWDIGISQFIGTNREPTLLDGTGSNGDAIKIPRYEQITQTSLDMSFVTGEWLWKGEALYRAGQGNENYYAWTGGFEYTFTRIWNSQMDLGVLGEWMYDTRQEKATNAFQNDLGGGLRLAFNNSASTETLFGWVQDIESSARLLFLEASHRFGDNLLLTAEFRAFVNQPATDFLFESRDDEILQVELAYYF